MWRVNYTGKNVKALFHILGLSSLLGCASIMLLLFTRIITQGYFLAVESDNIILFVEVICTLFAFSYSIYLFKRFFGDVNK